MSMTTFIVRNDNGGVLADRTSATMNYTHAVLVTGDGTPGIYSWHTSRELARKAADSLTGNAHVGTAKTGAKYSVVPVEAHKGGKAAVLKRLAVVAAEAELVQKVEAKRTRKGKGNGTEGPAEASVVAALNPPKAKRAAKATPAKKATKAAAPKQGDLPHPTVAWVELIDAAGLTQTGTAKVMGVAPMSMSRLMRGQGIPTASMTVKFAQAVGADVRELWAAIAEYELNLALAQA